MRLECNIIIVGAKGNVGQGILDAASKRLSKQIGRQWSVVAVDPAFEDGNEGSDQYQIHPSTLEDINEEIFDKWFDLAQHTEFVYAAEDGNRDIYASNPKLGQENDDCFQSFVKRVAACTCSPHCRHCKLSFHSRENTRFHRSTWAKESGKLGSPPAEGRASRGRRQPVSHPLRFSLKCLAKLTDAPF